MDLISFLMFREKKVVWWWVSGNQVKWVKVEGSEDVSSGGENAEGPSLAQFVTLAFSMGPGKVGAKKMLVG